MPGTFAVNLATWDGPAAECFCRQPCSPGQVSHSGPSRQSALKARWSHPRAFPPRQLDVHGGACSSQDGRPMSPQVFAHTDVNKKALPHPTNVSPLETF